MSKIIKYFLEIIYIIRRKIPKRVHTKIGNLIKTKFILKNLFSLPFGIIILKLSKNFYQLIPLKRNLLNFPLIILDVQAVDIFFEVFFENSYEKYNKIKPGDIVIDIGANIGLFTIKASQSTGKSGFIVAIEPEPRNIKVFNLNLKYYPDVILIPKAVGNFRGEIDLMIGTHSGSHTVNIDNDGDFFTKAIITVPIDTLDNIIKELNVKEIDFVKIDVEGGELEVLKGAVNVLNRIKFLAIAAYHNKADNILITEFLKTRNFKVRSDGKEVYAWNHKFLRKSKKA